VSRSSRNLPALASPAGRLVAWSEKAAALFRQPLALPWVRDSLGVALFPDRLIVSRVGGAGLRRVKHREIANFAPAAPTCRVRT
jgi:hypothetical protein